MVEVKTLIESMLKDLHKDMDEIRARIEKERGTNTYRGAAEIRRARELEKIRQHLKKLARRETRGKLTEKQQQLKKHFEEEIRRLNSKSHRDDIRAQADDARDRACRSLEQKLADREELQTAMQADLDSRNNDSRAEHSPPGSSAQDNVASGSATEGSSDELIPNYTDHLQTDERGTGGHTFDCGLPHPLTITRDESWRNENTMLTLDTRSRVRRVELTEEDVNMTLSNRNKITQNELTYFKANRREFNPSDMLQGRRRLRASGVNVLIGLDISGSMTSEWGAMFSDLSTLIEQVRDSLDIEEVIYFTYNSQLREHSKALSDLTIKAGGGNAFAHVYQQIMTTLPIMMKNELILITDCGDNLGFDLESVCDVRRNGERVINHISIIDTENAGFYNRNGFKADQWSLHRSDDGDLNQRVSENIERLIEQ